MLRSLHISNYVLIDSLDIEFPEGLVIITGQTGAGKSILLGAISLLFGAKADASLLLDAAKNCVVEGEFVSADSSILTIRRLIAPSGRSRCFVNDAPVQISTLSKLSDKLIDIHSQHNSLLLTDNAYQLSVLDKFAGDRDTLMECRKTWGLKLKAAARLEELTSRLQAFNRDRDYNLSQLEELQKANLREGELEELEAEHESLSNAESILEALNQVNAALEGSEAQPSVASALKEASRQLQHISRYFPSAQELIERLDSSRVEIEDILSELDSSRRSFDMSPQMLEHLEQRLSLIYTLLKKHSCPDVAALIQLRGSLSEGFEDSSKLEEEIEETKAVLEGLEKNYSSLSKTLSDLREQAAAPFAERIEESLRFLELDGASFRVKVERGKCGSDGCDRVSFLFSSNSNSEPRELQKVASGGELSRIMLCLKALMAEFTQMPTLIFDEIDTGVSGSVADKMGSMITAMGNHMQVFSITHLAQVDAKGGAHYLVSKSSDATGRTISRIERLSGEDRVKEIARLLSGATISDAALENARVLLDQGRA